MSNTMARPLMTRLDETERVILRWGERGYVVSIPVVWMREYGLSAGDTVLLKKQDGEVILKLNKDVRG